MLDSGELRTVDLGAATGLRFTDREIAAAVQGLPGGAGGRALQGKAQRLHRFHRRQGTRCHRQLHDSGAGMEIELPPDLRRHGQPVLEGWAIVDNTTGEDWTKVQAFAGFRPADFLRQPALCAEVRESPVRRAGRTTPRRGRWSIRAHSRRSDKKASPGSRPVD